MARGRRCFWAVIPAVAVAVCAAGGGAWYTGLVGRRTAREALAHPLELGASAWFNVRRPLARADLTGRPILYEFWSTYCPPCVALIPKLNAIQDRYRAEGLLVVAVSAEPAQTVASWVERFAIRYPTCAGSDTNPGDILPYAVLVSPAGRVVWQGDGRWVGGPLHRMLATVSGERRPDLIDEGSAVGFESDRPAFARAYDEGNLRVKLDALSQNIGQATQAALQEVFDFYWGNLPHDGWDGDADMRYAASLALFEIHIAAGKDWTGKVGGALQAEVLKRLEAQDVDWLSRGRIAMLARYVSEEGDAKAIAVVKRLLASERDPLVRLDLTETLETIDPGTPKTVDPPSPLQSARQRYREASTGLKARIFGLPSEFAHYRDYRESLEHRLSDPITEETIHALVADYRRHESEQASDLLIRAELLSTMRALPNLHELSPNVMETLQREVFRILTQPEADWMLRKEIALAQLGVGIKFLETKRLVEQLDDMIRSEPVRPVRAYLESLRLEANEPGAWD